MAASLFDSPLYARLFPTGEAGRLFADSAAVRAMLLVEGALAKVQGDLGIIPAESAAYIHRSAMEVQVDPGGLADATGQNGVAVPALVAAFRKAMEAPEHAQYVHWGSTSQDILDTGLMLRLRQLLAICETDLRATLAALSDMADFHAETPMTARTFGQYATLTTFGAQVAEWGNPLADLLDELPALSAANLLVSMSGAAGTSGAYGPKAADIRARVAEALRLGDPGRSWHVDRGPILRIADWLARLNVACGKLGTDLSAMAMSGISEIRLGATGSSSTMPQKQNPVGPSALIALARQATGLHATLRDTGMPAHQRDGGAWFTEWLVLPQVCLGAASALQIAKGLAESISPDVDRMAASVNDPLQLIHAEALSFALAAHMARPEAQAATKALCARSSETRTPLGELAAQEYPQVDLAGVFDPARQVGLAPEAARQFVQRVQGI